MPLAVTHILLTIIVVDLFRDYFLKKKLHKKFITLHMLIIAGIAGLLPDIDIPLNWIFTFFNYSTDLLKHGGITHTPIMGLLFLIPGIILWRRKKHKAAVYLFVITFGIFFHISLDYLLGGGDKYGIMWFWPISTQRFKIHLINNLGLHNLSMAVDSVILIAWLWHEEVKHKIRDFI
jgi:membrane-bound metal-dependent hydrolase YbcI (DUF457 family)